MEFADVKVFHTLPLKALADMGLSSEILVEFGIVVGLFTVVLTGVLVFYGLPGDEDLPADKNEPAVVKDVPPPSRPAPVPPKEDEPILVVPPVGPVEPTPVAAAPKPEPVEPTPVVVPPPVPVEPEPVPAPEPVAAPPPPEPEIEPTPAPDGVVAPTEQPEPEPAPEPIVAPTVPVPPPVPESVAPPEQPGEPESEPPAEAAPEPEPVPIVAPTVPVPPPVAEPEPQPEPVEDEPEPQPPEPQPEPQPEAEAEEPKEKKGWFGTAAAVVLAATVGAPAPAEEPVEETEETATKGVAFAEVAEDDAAPEESQRERVLTTQKSWMPRPGEMQELEDQENDSMPAVPEEEEEAEEPGVAQKDDDEEEASTMDFLTSMDGSIGQRETMEDVYDIMAATSNFSAATVCDGSHGRRAAETVVKVLKDWYNQRRSTEEKGMKDALAKAEQSCLSTAARNGKWVDATTAVIGTADATTVRVAWVGDPSAIVVRSEDYTVLTTPHVAANPDEGARIKNLGGNVARSQKEATSGKARKLFGKVAGKSLTFGTLKTNPKRCYPGGTVFTRALGGLPLKYSKPKLVVADPEFASIDRSPNDLCLILASDGLYEKIPVDDVVNDLRTVPDDAKATIAKTLVKKAQDAETSDNICAVVIWFK